MHRSIAPSILYFGTPVVLLSTLNDDGSCNVAPMSSAWWLGWSCMLGLGARGHTAQNLLRERECVLNLPSSAMASVVDRLARLTGSDPVPPHKEAMGYTHCKDKMSVAGLTAQASEVVKAPRVVECPVQLEAVLEGEHRFGRRPDRDTTAYAFEVRIVRAHVDESLLAAGKDDHIDPDAWRPLIMSFCQLYGLGGRAGVSRLAEIPERMYRPAAEMQR
ncbi:MAG: flavin reductase family protein [Acidobacteriaceae bacterium]